MWNLLASYVLRLFGRHGPSPVKKEHKKSPIMAVSKTPLREENMARHMGPISDVSSDVTIEVGSASFALHKDEKLHNVLGHFQKDFEGGVSAENLGSRFGGYGSFLPTYQRSPSWSHPRTPPEANNSSRQISPNNLLPEGGRQTPLGSSCTSLSGRPAASSARSAAVPALRAPQFKGERNSAKPTTQAEDSDSKSEKGKKPRNASDLKTLKVRIKVGTKNLLTRKNAEIYSGLGLDDSPSLSLDGSPMDSEGVSRDLQASPDESPTSILQIMTSHPVHDTLLLSPLSDELISLTENDKIWVNCGYEGKKKASLETLALVNGTHYANGEVSETRKLKTNDKDALAKGKGYYNQNGSALLSKKEIDIDGPACEALVSKALKLGFLSNPYPNFADPPKDAEKKVDSSKTATKGKTKEASSERAPKKSESLRIIVETITSLLPTQSRKSTVPMAFLSSLLRSAIASSASTSCRSYLERRIGLQLDKAILEDILIPANRHGNNHSSLYDIDSILRIFSFFLNLDEDDDEQDNRLRDESEMVYDFDSPGSPKHRSIIKVSKLLDNYLAAVALDSNLTASKYIALAELLPDHARLVYDGLYRAVDIFLKVHPNVKDSERYRLCKTIDFQKLSQEACSHAAQNERLPVQMVVQVLYFEQIRLRNAMNVGHNQFFGMNSQFPQRSGSGAGSGCISPRDNYASVRRENRELKLEVARMRMRLTDLEKDHVSMKQELVKSHSANKLFKSFTKKLSKLNALFRIRDLKSIGGKANLESRLLFQKRRRHQFLDDVL